jgi:hypothetical protein
MSLAVGLFLLIIFISACSILSKKKDTPKLIASDVECQRIWSYFDLNHKITGQIIAYHRAEVFCRAIGTASSTIMLTSLHDTIRIIELCNMSKEFKKSDSIEVIPADKPSFYVLISPDESYCYVKKTCYRRMTKLN